MVWVIGKQAATLHKLQGICGFEHLQAFLKPVPHEQHETSTSTLCPVNRPFGRSYCKSQTRLRLQFSKKKHLFFERQSYRERSSVCWFILEMAITSKAGLGCVIRSQSFLQVSWVAAGTQALEISSVAFPSTLTGSQTGSTAAQTPTGDHK